MSSYGPQWAQNLPQWVIFDLDGTLADIQHRLHYIKNEEKDWDKFNAACFCDEYKWKIGEMVRMFKEEMGRSIAIFTGREEKWRSLTEQWLEKRNVKYDLLEMRPSKNYASDTIIKRQMFEKHFEPKDIWLVLDDRDKVVKMWRDIGLTCLQVQFGDY